jgi:hypothetical protein
MMVVDFHEDDLEYDYLSTNTGQVTLSIQIATTTAGGNGAQNYTNRHPMTGSPLSTQCSSIVTHVYARPSIT